MSDDKTKETMAYTGIRCPHCQSRNWVYVFRSPVDPAGDKFKCGNGHNFTRYEKGKQ